jgi:small subunit ribosomal protein S18
MVDLPDEVKNMQTRRPAPAPRAEGAPRPERRDGPPRGDRPSGPRGEGGMRPRGDRPSGPRGEGGMGGERGGMGGPRRRRRLFWGGKVCQLCVKKAKYVDYKDADALRRFVSMEGKILPRRLSGACAHHQRMLTTAIKRARNVALLPFRTA